MQRFGMIGFGGYKMKNTEYALTGYRQRIQRNEQQNGLLYWCWVMGLKDTLDIIFRMRYQDK